MTSPVSVRCVLTSAREACRSSYSLSSTGLKTVVAEVTPGSPLAVTCCTKLAPKVIAQLENVRSSHLTFANDPQLIFHAFHISLLPPRSFSSTRWTFFPTSSPASRPPSAPTPRFRPRRSRPSFHSSRTLVPLFASAPLLLSVSSACFEAVARFADIFRSTSDPHFGGSRDDPLQHPRHLYCRQVPQGLRH